MTRADVLLLAGEIVGLAMRATVEQFDDALNAPGLTDGHQALLIVVTDFREDLESLLNPSEEPTS